ncbi:MAG: hypothetical protein IJX47_07430 [Clostridia bacterium]|nr:hypothetical protein [Clostridia bacterium]MBQ8383016.1 hypothetical protein [Clostridia bacterium]
MKHIALIFLLIFSILCATGCDSTPGGNVTTSSVTTADVELSGDEYNKFEFVYPSLQKSVTVQSNKAVSDAFSQLMDYYIKYDTLVITVDTNSTFAVEKKLENISYETLHNWTSPLDSYYLAKLEVKYNDFDADDWLALAADDEIIFISVTIPYVYEFVDD